MIKFIWYGTASVELDINGQRFLFDPFLKMNKKAECPSVEDFCCADFIFNTHPHFDHIYDMPEILKKGDMHAYGTQTMKLRLEEKDISESRIHVLASKEKVEFENATILPYKSQHCQSDLKTLFQVIFRSIFHFQVRKCLKLLKIDKQFPLENDILSYEIQAEGKSILIFGSAGFDDGNDYPQNIDVLVCPFQGRADIGKYALKFIEKIKPKKVVLSHFDNAFPPITYNLNTDKFVKLMKKNLPEIEVVVPKFKEEIVL